MDWFLLISGLFGGLALFLLGLNFLTRSLEILAGEQMSRVLEQLTRNRFTGVLTGAAVTAAVNSSSVTTVLLVGFVSAGLMTMSQSVAVVMGANIGSTVTAQILAFDIGRLSLPMIALGFAVSVLGRSDRIRESGRILLGLGLVFYGMQLMGQSMAPLRSFEPFIAGMAQMQRPLLGILAGAVFTALVQSSAATLGIAIILASQGILTLEAAIAIALGSNIGTCVTAGLAVLGKPREAVRVFVAHLLFNLIGAALWLPFIPQLAAFVDWLSLGGPDAVGRDIANAHTLFNVANTLLFIGFVPQIGRLITRLVPEPVGATKELMAPRFLDPGLLQSPSVALAAARRELTRVAEQTAAMVDAILPALVERDTERLNVVHDQLPRVRQLNDAILAYLAELSRVRLGERQSAELTALLQIGQFVMAIADLAGDDLLRLANRRERWPGLPDASLAASIARLNAVLANDIKALPALIAERNLETARAIRNGKHALHAASRDLTRAAFERVAGSVDPRRTRTYAGSVETMEILGRIHRLCRKIAKLELDHAEAASAPAPAVAPAA